MIFRYVFCNPLVLLFALFNGAFAQKRAEKIDSLLQVFVTATHDTTKGFAMTELANEIYYSDLDSSYALCLGARELAKKNLSRKRLSANEEFAYKKIMSSALVGISYMHLQRAENQEALKVSEQALVFLKEIDDLKGMGVAWSNIGVVYKDFGDFSKSLDAYSKSLKYLELDGDLNGKATTLLNIAYVYAKQGEHEMAVEYDSLAMKIWQEIGEERGLAAAYNNMAANYNHLNRGEKVLEFYQKSLLISEKYGHKKGIAVTLGNLGDQYLKMDSLSRAEEMYDRQGKIYAAMGNDRFLSRHYVSISNLHLKKGNTSEALTSAKKAMELAESTGFPADMRKAAAALARVYEKRQDWKNAFESKQLYIAMRDSVKSIENEKAILKSQYQFAYEKQALADSLKNANEQALLVSQNEKQKVGLVGAGVGFVLILALAFAIYSGKKKSDELLLNILPKETAEELKQKGHANAKLIDDVTVLFTDFKGFTAVSELLTPKALVEDLNECFSAFDRIMENHGIEKIKTIGDAYMAACGLPSPNDQHAHNVVRAAFAMRDFIEKGKQSKIKSGLPYFEIRIGIHTGPVVAGIVGIKKFQYDIWGDTVNTASKMEGSGKVGKVNISESTYELVKSEFNCTHRGKIAAKGKGELEMYFVEPKG